jgi:hypothetical protein
MKTIIQTALVAVIVAAAALTTSQAKAYFYQPWQPSPYYSYPTYYRQTTDLVTPLVAGNIGLVSNFTYIPAPIHPYFYNYGYNLYSPYAPYGFGY